MNTPISAGQVLREKGYGYSFIQPSATVYEALELMAEKNIGALLVMEQGKLVGMFSERDYARKVILKGKSSKSTSVRELMTAAPITITPQESMNKCMMLMTENHVRHLPVMNGDVLLGVVSIGDVVNSIISQQETAIQDLEDYISLGY